MTILVLFPGQGSQHNGMGAELFDRYPELVARAESVLGYSLRELCLDNPDGRLGKTEFTQPALYVVNALHYRAFLDGGGREPDFVAGHSLGEYNALLAAEAFDFETGLRLVQRRGMLMGGVTGSGMCAVTGIEAEVIRQVLAEARCEGVDLANLNAPEQTVLAGQVEDLEALRPRLEARPGCRVVPLRVSAAFHSRLMRDVKQRFAAFIEGFGFAPLCLPTMSNFTALPYRDDEIAHNLVQQIDHPVRWVELVQYLLQEDEPEFKELGPGSVLTRLVTQIRAKPVPVNIRRYY